MVVSGANLFLDTPKDAKQLGSRYLPDIPPPEDREDETLPSAQYVTGVLLGADSPDLLVQPLPRLPKCDGKYGGLGNIPGS